VEECRLVIDLHKNANRQVPGSDAETEKSLDLARVDRSAPLHVADVGCGTGASTLLLARLLNARVTAVDLFPGFLDVLESRAEHFGISAKVATLSCSMNKLPFGNAAYDDVIWSEGAIYNMGFARGGQRMERVSEEGRSFGCFGAYLDNRLASV